jgi:hypothetical protein
MPVSINGTNGITFFDASTQATAATGFGFKNRLINGGMTFDQRNGGASVTPTTSNFVLDRWQYTAAQASKVTSQQNAGSVTPPIGFSNYLGITVAAAANVTLGSTDIYTIRQAIEGFNFADMGFGTASASAVTVSFWVRSSLTGTFGGALKNATADRSYPFSFTISSANTWTSASVTIPGDTSGTWVGATNGVGAILFFSLGSGSASVGTANVWTTSNVFAATGSVNPITTNSATFYITGVQLEKGSTATSFDYRPYGTELALCQRYYYKQQATGTLSIFGSGFNNSTTLGVYLVNFPVALRTDPAALEQSGTAANYQVYYGGSATVCSAVPSFNSGNVWGSCVLFSVASGLTTGQASLARSASTSAYLAWSAEL